MNGNTPKAAIIAVMLTVLMPLAALIPADALAGDCTGIKVSTGVDLYNRYVWRGLDIADTPSIQPALSLSWSVFEMGAWGAYTLSNQSSDSDELDLWLGYMYGFENGASIGLLVTDYYYPNAGIGFFNFNDWDAVDDDDNPDPGAHIIELGLSLTGPESFPLTVSGYVNVRGDAGNNVYFQVDYPLTAGDVDLGLFCGIAAGSEDNPGYYGTDDLAAINIGVSAAREIEVSETFSLPLSVAFVVNPEAEISYLVAGMSF